MRPSTSSTRGPVRRQPLTFRSCALSYCYDWAYLTWSSVPCPVTCGIGFQPRPLICRDWTGGYNAEPAYCGSPTATIQPCDPTPPHCYGWRVGLWSACDQPICGNGFKTRDVWCQDLTAGVESTDQLKCLGTKPDDTAACKVANCYAWDPQGWGGCSATCGVSTQTRSIHGYDE
jgi:predicted membrane protein